MGDEDVPHNLALELDGASVPHQVEGNRLMTTYDDRMYAHLDAINNQSWAELAHTHIADEGPTGMLARALACAVQLAADGRQVPRQIIPSTHAATPKVALFPNPELP